MIFFLGTKCVFYSDYKVLILYAPIGVYYVRWGGERYELPEEEGIGVNSKV